MASVGCSLMEAYNVPSFDPPRRRKGCVVDTGDIKTSSEPYDPFIDQRGHGGSRNEMAAFPSRKPQTKEAFENSGATMPKYYSGYTQDKKYYCDTYNICPKTTEGFEGSPIGSVSDTTPTPAPAKKQAVCTGPLMAPNYEYPMTPEARRQYDKAIDLSVNQPQGSTPYEIPPPLSSYDKKGGNDIAGYTDEDLDQFLKTNEMKSTPFDLPRAPKDDRVVPGRDPQATPFAETMKNFTAADGTPQLRPASATDAETTDASSSASASKKDPWDKVWDMALFVVAGLLIILLLDQLFKLAMLYGMKRAFLAIEPLLVKAMASE